MAWVSWPINSASELNVEPLPVFVQRKPWSSSSCILLFRNLYMGSALNGSTLELQFYMWGFSQRSAQFCVFERRERLVCRILARQVWNIRGQARIMDWGSRPIDSVSELNVEPHPVFVQRRPSISWMLLFTLQMAALGSTLELQLYMWGFSQRFA